MAKLQLGKEEESKKERKEKEEFKGKKGRNRGSQTDCRRSLMQWYAAAAINLKGICIYIYIYTYYTYVNIETG